MNANQAPRRPQKNASPAANRNVGGRNPQKRSKKRNKKKPNRSAIDPNRPMWENPAGDAELRTVVGSVRPAHNPTAIIQSLGDPPLGKYATNAHHYYEAVYEKAQHFAVAIAAANGLLVEDDEPTSDAPAE